ncbi:hypothetical protein FXO37_36275 [Capsicum annuum]|nr:hypothetical protein FXO37_36275 [Capsicum annuum]
MTPLEMVVIDEAAQLKECESTIPLQLLGLCHAILIGDEKQLPTMFQRKIWDGIEEDDNGDSIFHFDDDDEDEDAILAAIEELFERSW